MKLFRALAVIGVIVAAFALFAFDLRKARTGEVLTESFRSEPLGKSVAYSVYLPHGARDGAHAVVYLLHGAGGDGRDWLDKGDLQKTVDQLVKSKAIPPAIYVMPDMSGCWWINAPRCAFETFFREEFDPFIQRKYAATDGGEVKRYIVGVSIGGFGAIRLALTRPGSFAGVAALSAAIYREQPPTFSALLHDTPFEDASGQFDLPFWRSINYTGALPGYAQQSARSTFFIAAGAEDPSGAADEAIAFEKALTAVKDQKSTLQISNGGHDWDYWKSVLPVALETLMRSAPSPSLAASPAVAEAGGAPQFLSNWLAKLTGRPPKT